MQLGSPEHKAQFLQDLIKAFYENIWKDEIQLLEFDKLLGNLRTQKADADLKLERKEFKSANEGKEVIARIDAEIESVIAATNKQKAIRISGPSELNC